MTISIYIKNRRLKGKGQRPRPTGKLTWVRAWLLVRVAVLLLLLLRVRGAFGRPGLRFPAGIYYKHRISEIGPGRQNHSKSLFFLGPEASGGHFVGGTPCRGRASRLPFPSTSYHACVALLVFYFFSRYLPHGTLLFSLSVGVPPSKKLMIQDDESIE